MRHFIVLGFATNSNSDQGKSLYLGQSRSKAMSKVNEQDDKCRRRELYELAVPQVRRHTPVQPAATDEAVNTTDEAES